MEIFKQNYPASPTRVRCCPFLVFSLFMVFLPVRGKWSYQYFLCYTLAFIIFFQNEDNLIVFFRVLNTFVLFNIDSTKKSEIPLLHI